ncbi:MAG: hypothetical protein R6V23_16245 [Bacteroidales bacterium]
MNTLIKLFSIAILMILTSCATTKTHSEANTTQKVKFSANSQKVYQIALRTALQQKWEIKMKDSENYMFQGETPSSMNKWPDDVGVYIVKENNKTIMTIKSTLGHEPNKKFIKEYISQIKEKIKQ